MLCVREPAPGALAPASAWRSTTKCGRWLYLQADRSCSTHVLLGRWRLHIPYFILQARGTTTIVHVHNTTTYHVFQRGEVFCNLLPGGVFICQTNCPYAIIFSREDASSCYNDEEGVKTWTFSKIVWYSKGTSNLSGGPALTFKHTLCFPYFPAFLRYFFAHALRLYVCTTQYRG